MENTLSCMTGTFDHSDSFAGMTDFMSKGLFSSEGLVPVYFPHQPSLISMKGCMPLHTQQSRPQHND